MHVCAYLYQCIYIAYYLCLLSITPIQRYVGRNVRVCVFVYARLPVYVRCE